MQALPYLPKAKLNLERLSTHDNNQNNSLPTSEVSYDKDVCPYLSQHVYQPFISKIYPDNHQLYNPTLQIQGVIIGSNKANLHQEPYFLQLIALLGTDEHFYKFQDEDYEIGATIFHQGAFYALGTQLDIKSDLLCETHKLLNKLLKLPEFFWPYTLEDIQEQIQFKAYLQILKRELETIYYIASINEKSFSIKKALEQMLMQLAVCAPGLLATLNVVKGDLCMKNIYKIFSTFIFEKISSYHTTEVVTGKLEYTQNNSLHALIKLVKIAQNVGLDISNVYSIHQINDFFEHLVKVNEKHFTEYLYKNISLNDFLTYIVSVINKNIKDACKELEIQICDNGFIPYSNYLDLQSHIVYILKKHAGIASDVEFEIPLSCVELKYEQDTESEPKFFRINNIEQELLKILYKNNLCSDVEKEVVVFGEDLGLGVQTQKITLIYINLGEDHCPTLCYINQYGQLTNLPNADHEVLDKLFTHASNMLVLAVAIYAARNGYKEILHMVYEKRTSCFSGFVFARLYVLAIKHNQYAILEFLIDIDQNLNFLVDAVINNQCPVIRRQPFSYKMQKKSCVDFLINIADSKFLDVLINKKLIQSDNLPALAQKSQDIIDVHPIMKYIAANNLIFDYLGNANLLNAGWAESRIFNLFKGTKIEELILEYFIENELINDLDDYEVIGNDMPGNIVFMMMNYFVNNPEALNDIYDMYDGDLNKKHHTALIMRAIARLEYIDAAMMINKVLASHRKDVIDSLCECHQLENRIDLVRFLIEKYYDDAGMRVDAKSAINKNAHLFFEYALKKGDSKLAMLTLALGDNISRARKYLEKHKRASKNAPNFQEVKSALIRPGVYAFPLLDADRIEKLLHFPIFQNTIDDYALVVSFVERDVHKIKLCLRNKILLNKSSDYLNDIFGKIIDIIHEKYNSVSKDLFKQIVYLLQSQSSFKILDWYSKNKEAAPRRVKILENNMDIDIIVSLEKLGWACSDVALKNTDLATSTTTTLSEPNDAQQAVNPKKKPRM